MITQKINSDHKIQQSHWLVKTIFRPTQNPILLNIENSALFLALPLVLQNFTNIPNHITIKSLKPIKINKFRPPSPAISLAFFLHSDLYTSVFNNLCMLVH
jgi:hypothetical protein